LVRTPTLACKCRPGLSNSLTLSGARVQAGERVLAIGGQ
jgi:hypothetical protein